MTYYGNGQARRLISLMGNWLAWAYTFIIFGMGYQITFYRFSEWGIRRLYLSGLLESAVLQPEFAIAALCTTGTALCSSL